MCLTTKQRWPKIAWKPITTYKVVCSCGNFYKTIYRQANIHIGKTYREPVSSMLTHKDTAIDLDNKTKYYEFNEGIHSVTEKDSAKSIAEYFEVLYPVEIVECRIPRFSLYWIGNDGDIVSNKLKYVKIL